MSSSHDAQVLEVPGTEGRPNPDWQPLDKLFEDAVGQGLLSGGVVMAWHRGVLAHATAIGERDIARHQPMCMDTIFRLYSMTKPVMAIAMMILWDEGKWQPSDPVAKFLPELAAPKVVAGTNDAGEPIFAVARTQPTLEHLMTHQTGFSYGFSDDAVDRVFREVQLPIIPCDLPAAEYLSRLAQIPLAFEPGTGWRYGVGMDVQGIIVERLSGMSLRDFMRERIFMPLGMVDTDFLVPAAKRDRLATLYGIDGGKLVELTRDTPSLGYDNMAALLPRDMVPAYDHVPIMASGGGGLVGTATDYLQIGRMLANGGEVDGVRILTPEAVALMTRSHTPHLLAGQFGTAPHNLRPGYEFAYNGVAITDPEAADVALGLGTYFWDGAAGCWFWVDPAHDVILVALVQLMTDAEKLSLQFRSRGVVANIVADLAR